MSFFKFNEGERGRDFVEPDLDDRDLKVLAITGASDDEVGETAGSRFDSLNASEVAAFEAVVDQAEAELDRLETRMEETPSGTDLADLPEPESDPQKIPHSKASFAQVGICIGVIVLLGAAGGYSFGLILLESESIQYLMHPWKAFLLGYASTLTGYVAMKGVLALIPHGVFQRLAVLLTSVASVLCFAAVLFIRSVVNAPGDYDLPSLELSAALPVALNAQPVPLEVPWWEQLREVITEVSPMFLLFFTVIAEVGGG
ncbi:MAG: hypothetical protein AAF357_18605 [Verrucomicrobiota bacterium]